MGQSGPTGSRQLPRWGRLIGGLLAALVIVTGCIAQPGLGPSTVSGKSLTIGAMEEPPTLDPSASSSAAVPQALLYNVYETLIKLGPDGAPRPLLAQEWELSPDRLSYTFHLNPAAKFASGHPVTAAAVVASFAHAKGPGVDATIQHEMAVVKNCTAVDDHTVQVTLTRPSNLWLQDITTSAGIIYDPDGLTSLGMQPAGSGPYVLKEWALGRALTLRKNQGYWGTPARFDTVSFRYFADPNAMTTAELSGEIDIISAIATPETLSQFSDPSRFTVFQGSTTGEVVLALNNAEAPFKKLALRRAIALAIDKRAVLGAAWSGKGTVIGGMAVPTDPWYEDLTSINSYDPDEAKALMKSAGHQKGIAFTLRIPSAPYATRAATLIVQELGAIGISVSVEELDMATWIKQVRVGGHYDLALAAFDQPRGLRAFADKDTYFHYNNPAFTKQFVQADQADEESFVVEMKEASRTLATDAAAVWLFDQPNLVVARAGITGVAQNSTTPSFDVTTIASR